MDILVEYYLDFLKFKKYIVVADIMGRRQVARLRFLVPPFAGSNPSAPEERPQDI